MLHELRICLWRRAPGLSLFVRRTRLKSPVLVWGFWAIPHSRRPIVWVFIWGQILLKRIWGVQALLGFTQATLQNAVVAGGFAVSYAADGSAQKICDARVVDDITSSVYSSDAATVNSAVSDVIQAGNLVAGAQQDVADAAAC